MKRISRQVFFTDGLPIASPQNTSPDHSAISRPRGDVAKLPAPLLPIPVPRIPLVATYPLIPPSAQCPSRNVIYGYGWLKKFIGAFYLPEGLLSEIPVVQLGCLPVIVGHGASGVVS
jgi:hypothetical protein